MDPLDKAIDAVRFDEPGVREVGESKARVWARLAEEVEAEAESVREEIQGCEDFRKLMPAYRAGRLNDARELLLQDHLHECGACRREYETGGRSNVLAWKQPERAAKTAVPLYRRYAMAASLLVAVAAGAYLFRDQFFPADAGPRATLASASGPAYKISASGQKPIQPGETITEKEWIRTASGSKAMVRLRDGSTVEMNERTELGVTLNRTDTTVYLERGNIIVQAAKRRQGHLIVHTEDTDVYVTGTVFSVNRGVLGSRVSVAEGSVAVKRRGTESSLKPGEQYVSSRFVSAEPVEQEFAWSANASEHLALLNEFAKLKNQWQKMQLPELRYDSVLLRQMPANTVFFAGLPNLGGTIDQAWRTFEGQASQSPVLKQWWQEHEAAHSGKSMAEVVARIKTFHEYLGKEVVFAGTRGADGRQQYAFIAEVTKSGLEEFLQSQLEAGEKAHLYRIVNNTIVISPDEANLNAWAAWAAARTDSGFATTGLGQKLIASYQQGTGLIVGVDVQAMRPGEFVTPASSGLNEIRYFVAEHRTLQQRNDLDSELKAAMTFSGTRKGLAAILAAPGPAGSLDYFSPNSAVAVSMVSTRAEAIYDEFLTLVSANSSGMILKEIQEIEQRTGMSIRNDIAQSLGSDATFGLDGALLPVPAWKAVFEVKDSGRLQLFMERIVAELDTELKSKGKQGVTLTQEAWDGKTLYSVKLADGPAGFQYVFTDGYWILGPDRNALTRAVRAKSQNWRLVNSWEFRERLPQAPSPHYSGLVYMNFTNVADMIGDAAGMAVPADQLQSFQTLASSIRPALICLYGENDSIRIQTRTGLLGLTMDQWLGASGLRDLLGNSPLKMLKSEGTPQKQARIMERRNTGLRRQ